MSGKEDKPRAVEGEGCRCLEATPGPPQSDLQCPGTIKVPTAREEEILKSILEVSEEARRLKELIGRLESDPAADAGELSQAREQFETLRQKRAELETLRVEAAEERMRLLGHA